MISMTQFRQAVSARPVSFFITFFITVFITYAILYIVDFYPEPKSEDVTAGSVSEEKEEIIETEDEIVEIEDKITAELAPVPLFITIEKLDKTIPVSNPESRLVSDLDNALLSGAVRHPDSADFAKHGNIFILGHSSYLPNVMNKNFQAFNGIQDLSWGHHIFLDSADTRYVYRVQKVYEAKASDVVVPFTPGESRLTLATCNSFASKDDRFVVEAVLVEQTPLPTNS